MKWILVAISLLSSVQIHAAAFCALRDPLHQISLLYPGYSSFESEVKSIHESVANAHFADHGLPITLHAKEIGKDTLFYIHDESDLLGMVHVRSEPGTWGPVEIAWSISPDGKIQDYRFQKCRGGFCSAANSAVLREKLQGLTSLDLAALFDDEGEIKPIGLVGAQQLWETMVRSAVKTLVLTQAFWSGHNNADPRYQRTESPLLGNE